MSHKVLLKKVTSQLVMWSVHWKMTDQTSGEFHSASTYTRWFDSHQFSLSCCRICVVFKSLYDEGQKNWRPQTIDDDDGHRVENEGHNDVEWLCKDTAVWLKTQTKYGVSSILCTHANHGVKSQPQDRQWQQMPASTASMVTETWRRGIIEMLDHWWWRTTVIVLVLPISTTSRSWLSIPHTDISLCMKWNVQWAIVNNCSTAQNEPNHL